ncbi:ATP-binding protein [Saccharopolyspora shandongensis]|uniref:hybrid sensor histidine kinase/response regulator n=1 Tax=Saccharopolyspora shandongensis TaxID=418495 RepID=UPI00344417E3
MDTRKSSQRHPRYSDIPADGGGEHRKLLHDMGNELGVALGVAELLSESNELPAATRQGLHTIMEAIYRADELRSSVTLRNTNFVDTANLLTCQSAVLELIARKAPLSATLARLASGMEQHLPGTHCSILLLNSDTCRLYHGAAPTLPDSYTAEIDGMAIGPVAGSCGTAAYAGKPVIVSDILVDERWNAFRDVGVRHGLRACWSSPVISPRSSDVLGTFAVYHSTPHSPSVEERVVVERFTHLAAVAIEHHRLFSELHESEERFRSAFTHAAIGMALADRDGRLIHVNAALCTDTGYDVDDLHSTYVSDLISGDGAADVRAAVRRLVAGTSSSYLKVHEYRHADGTLRCATMVISPVKDSEGHTRFVCLQLRDITDRLRIEREMRAREAAERANLVKSEFVSQLSHEMRTPITAVLGFAELLTHGGLPADDATDCAQHIVDAAEYLERLIDDTLCMTHADAGRLPIQSEAVDLLEVVEDSLTLTRSLAESNDVTLRVVPPGGECLVTGDRQRSRQVLVNLLTNAIKYNRPGGLVTVRTEPAGEFVRLTVEDTGRGIAPADLPRIFTPFQRAGVQPGDPCGHGLGLAVAKKLVIAMRGRMDADSELGSGSRFWVDLPRHDDARAEAPGAGRPPRIPAQRRGDHSVVLYLHGDLHSIDAVVEAQRVRPRIRLRCVYQFYGEVEELIGFERPDLVVIDLDDSEWSQNLPHLVRRHPLTADKPVVCLTDSPAAVLADDLGAPHFLRNPVELSELLEIFDRELPVAGEANTT